MVSGRESTPLVFEVRHDQGGMRLDAFLATVIDDLSRSRASWHIRNDHVVISNPPAKYKPSTRLVAAMKVNIDFVPAPVSEARPQDIALNIVWEDEHLLVVNKAAGMVVHPAAGHPDGTLINAVLHHVPQVADLGHRLRPGLVHRIDKDTSGLLVVAKTVNALKKLARSFAGHEVQRRYAAVCLGRFRHDRLTIETLHVRHPKHRKRFSGRVDDGKQAITHLHCLARSTLCSLLVCRLETGRTHQIRVHLSERGHPIAGDELYGGVRNHPKTLLTKPELALLRRLERQALHAYALGFEHPQTGQQLRFELPWPDDLRPLVEGLFEATIQLPSLDTPPQDQTT
jgi:23S rRNA pseudouridine1911/1915/1917 synthase